MSKFKQDRLGSQRANKIDLTAILYLIQAHPKQISN